MIELQIELSHKCFIVLKSKNAYFLNAISQNNKKKNLDFLKGIILVKKIACFGIQNGHNLCCWSEMFGPGSLAKEIFVLFGLDCILK